MATTQNNPDVTRHPSYSFIRTNINYLRDIPAPEEGRWKSHEAPLGVRDRIRNCIEQGIVEKDERIGRSERFYYRTKRKPYRDIQYALGDVSLGPCGHTGVDNLQGEDAYSCGYEYCDSRFGREVAERVLRG